MPEYDSTIVKRVGYTFMTSDPGGKRDWFACVVWKIGKDKEGRKVLVAIDSMRAKLSGKKTREDIYRDIVTLYNKHKCKTLVIEANGLGAPIAETLSTHHGLTNQRAVTVVNRVKRDDENRVKERVLDINEIIQLAHTMIENATLLCYETVDIELRKQTLAYIKKISDAGNVQYRAGTGHDDYVSCLRLAVFHVTKDSEIEYMVVKTRKMRGYSKDWSEEPVSWDSAIPQHIRDWQSVGIAVHYPGE